MVTTSVLSTSAPPSVGACAVECRVAVESTRNGFYDRHSGREVDEFAIFLPFVVGEALSTIGLHNLDVEGGERSAVHPLLSGVAVVAARAVTARELRLL